MAVPLKSNEILKELNLKKSTFYYLIKNNLIQIPTTKTGRYIWDDEVILKIKELMAEDEKKLNPSSLIKLKTIQIQNRRYLGNKYKLTGFITEIVETECKEVNTVADIFSGTGSVASAFINKKIITNDLLYSNYICNLAWFGSQKYDREKIENLIIFYNTVAPDEENYMSINFANTYFSASDCKKIGYIRQDIEEKFNCGQINNRERALLITSLLYAMDKIANTCGHYDAYIRGASFNKKIELCLPLAENENNVNNQCYNEDTNELVKRIEADLVYIDPPYNSRQYCDAYHLLENVARWEKPEVTGVALKMDRKKLKSDYCTNSATKAFEDLIANIKAKYILLSYNNMASKGNQRSNARISDTDIMRILSCKGKVKVFSKEYKAFTAGKSAIEDNEERLFLCECYEHQEKELIQSPLNYTGGKFKLLPQILPHFPKNYSYFIDLFCGGCNVGINVPCNKVLFNDNNELLRLMFSTFLNLDKDVTFELIDSIIEEYGLSNTDKNGYEYYGCDSSTGLANFNKEGYLRLREDFNSNKTLDYKYYVMLYVLVVYAFNNQIRFNKKGEFNLPAGKRDFNSKMREKLSAFIDRLKSGDYTFSSEDFRKLQNEEWDKNTFVYADPPYLIGCATYNEQDGWNEELEKELLTYLDSLDARGIKFALSNVLHLKGKENKIIIEWLSRNVSKYRVIYLNYSYANSNYQTKDRTTEAEEVLIVNY